MYKFPKLLLITFIFRNKTIFWNISRWNKGQKEWDRGSKNLQHYSNNRSQPLPQENTYGPIVHNMRSGSVQWPEMCGQ